MSSEPSRTPRKQDETTIHDDELERLSVSDGEIDPKRYSKRNAGCLFVVLGVIGGVIAMLKILNLFALL